MQARGRVQTTFQRQQQKLVTDCTKARKGKGRKTVVSRELEPEQSGLSDAALEAEKGWGPH